MSADQFRTGNCCPLKPWMRLIDVQRKNYPRTSELSGVLLVYSQKRKLGGNHSACNRLHCRRNDYDSWMVRGLPKAGDVVVTTEAPLGECCLHVGRRECGTSTAGIVTLRGKPKAFYKTDSFVMSCKALTFRDQLESRATGSTVQQASNKVNCGRSHYRFRLNMNKTKIAGYLSALD